MVSDILLPMFDDDYYPDILVAEIKLHIQRFAKKLEGKELSDSEIYHFAQQATKEINRMKIKFEELDSSLDDAAADYIAEAMMMVVQAAGYFEIEMEELISNREW